MYSSRLAMTTRRSAFNKSHSSDAFYKEATQRSQHYQSSRTTYLTTGNPNTECLACKHEQQENNERMQPRILPKHNQAKHTTVSNEYYSTANNSNMPQSDAVHLNRTKRFLQQLLDSNKDHMNKAVYAYESKIRQLTQEGDEKDAVIKNLQVSKALLQRSEEPRSIVNTYKNSTVIQQQPEQVEQLRQQVDHLRRKVAELQDERNYMREQAVRDKKIIIEAQQKQQKYKEYDIYAKEYETMRITIDNEQSERLGLMRKHEKSIKQLKDKHSIQIDAYQEKLGEYHESLQTTMMELEKKNRQLSQVKEEGFQLRKEEVNRLKDLLDERNAQCERLESQINCIQAELAFIKNRYGYLLKDLPKNQTSTGASQLGKINEVGESGVEQFCIERIGRYNVSTGKQSLLSMNLSPIKKRGL